MPGFAPVDPKQSFPDLEQVALERWREQDLFARSLAERADAPIWSFYEGPPTANGRPGSHHVLARVFKDIYPRYRTMCGYRVPRKAGWDCHGLPVELEVEKQLGISSKQEIEEFGIAEFNQRCRESVFEYVEEWNRLTERIGFWVDLDDPYVTLQDRYIESVWWSLRELFEKGRLYEGHKVVPYCPRDGTPLSSHEVAQGYQDVKDASIYVRFPLLGDDGAPSGESLLVWTTTPWTLPGNVAVAVAPDVEYVRASLDGETLIVAAPLFEKVLGEGAEVLDRIKGADLVDRRYAGPVFELADGGPTSADGSPTFRVVAGDFVTTDDGTGLVHIAPPFGEDDYLVGASAGLFDPTVAGTLYNPVRPDGTFDDRVIGFAGEFVKGSETTRRLIDQLAERGLLFREQVYEHAYPHCWRCGTPLLYYATTSWYIATSAAREELLANNETIGWHPEHVKHGRFGKWLENNVDWALSRNRYWGTPLPIWRCTDAGCETVTCIGSVEELSERSGGEAPPDLHRPYIDEVTIRCQDCGGDMQRVSSVIDTWYDSGAMPFAQFHYPFEGKEEFAERFPADYICEAQDQTRGWFYTLLAESTLLFDQSSFRNCVCLGLILDPEGQKMSKSRGNVVDPWDVLATHGADAFRWYYLTTQQPWAGYRFSVETVGESVRNFMLQLWNTYSFWVLYANAEGLGPDALRGAKSWDSEENAPREETDIDRWALSRLQATVATVRERMDDFDCTTAGRAIADFVEELSNWYVRLSRRRFWEGDPAAFATLRTCLLETATMLAPFTPFLADEMYRNLAGGADGEFGEAPDSVHLRDFPAVDEARRDDELEAGMAAVRLTVRLGLAARSSAKVKLRQPLRRAVIVATESERAGIEAHADLVKAELNVKELDFVSDEGDLVSYEVKPNYRALGPRFGKKMPQVAAAIAALDPAHVAAVLAEGGQIGISIDGVDHTLGPDDVTMALRPLEGYEVEAEAGHAVALELEIDEELRREGLAREIVHAVQNARKEAGLEITDRIALGLTGDAELLEVAGDHEAYLGGETLASSITFGDDDGAGSTAGATTIDGRELRISLRAV
ncbi:MAG TPA: isoleucine--tRNA ligase [Solirubrobacterales bacterium]|jgi:isoleucyl-tRNA synthetase|nr:isoleucine--tRNA ligase [Solirubrobacterales bacterium]